MNPPSKPARHLLRVLCIASLAAACSAHAATVTSTWTNAASGNWNVDANWTNVPPQGGFPNNGNGDTYDALISATGTAYTVTLNTSVTVEALILNSANATLAQTAGTLQANGGINLTSGSLLLSAGTISSSTITAAPGTLRFGASNNNLLMGVTVNGDLNLTTTGARTRIAAGTSFTTAHLSGARSELGFAPGQTLTGTILFEGPASATSRYVAMNGTAGTFTVGPTGIIRTEPGFGDSATIGSGFNFSGAMTLVNQGLISSQVSARTITIDAPSLTNTGTLEAKNGGILNVLADYTQNGGTTRVDNGDLSAGTSAPFGTVIVASGRLEGRGTINAQVANSATISPGLSAGTLAINGDLSLTGTSEIRIELGGTVQGTQYDLLSEAGTIPLTLAGTLSVSFLNGFESTVQASDTFTIIASNQAITGAFANLVGGRIEADDAFGILTGSFAVNLAGNNVTLGSWIPVPEPATAVLSLLGLSLLARRGRRREVLRSEG